MKVHPKDRVFFRSTGRFGASGIRHALYRDPNNIPVTPCGQHQRRGRGPVTDIQPAETGAELRAAVTCANCRRDLGMPAL